MESRFSLREATVDDVPRIMVIEQKVHVAPWTAEHFLAELEKPYSKIWLLTDDETDTEVAAYIVFWEMFDECQILNVVVDLSYRGSGYAQMLIRKAADMALKANLKRVFLNVRKSNVPAIQLYQKLQFTIQHVRKAFYSNGEDAYELVLPLQGQESIDF